MAVREAAQPPEHLKVIDSDAFFTEPHDLWTRRAPAHLRERVPQVKMVDGRASWVIDGNKPLGRGSNPGSAIGKDGTKAVGRGYQSLEREDVLRASYDLEARLALMDEAGIRAQIIYPNLLGFGGQHMFGFGGQRSAEVDPQLKLACVQIYNDAMAELQQRSSQRLFPMALVPWWDVRLAAEEAARAAGLGLRGINMHSDPHWYRGKVEKTLSDLAHPDWDPLWEVCCERNLPVNFHIGASEQGSTDWYANQWPTLSQDKRTGAGGAMLFFNNGRAVANLIFSGLLDRHPKLQFVSVESGIGWIPFLLESIDYHYREVVMDSKLRRRPSEYFRTNFHACFWFERSSLVNAIRVVGADNVMFETNFPHPTCLYPLDRHTYSFPGLTEEERHKVLSGNAARLYRIPIS
jgi:uncharacterized protein